MFTLSKRRGGDPHVMKERYRRLSQILSVELCSLSSAKGGLDRDTLLEVPRQLLDRHYADTRRPFADIRQRGSASW
jgi:hypothetical protein